MDWPTQRKYQRVRVALQGELRCYSDSFPRRAETTDICLGGCYFNMPYTLEPKTKTEVTLWLGTEKFKAKAEVVTNHPQVGNGLKFVNMDDADRLKLEKFITTVLSGSNSLARAAKA